MFSSIKKKFKATSLAYTAQEILKDTYGISVKVDVGTTLLQLAGEKEPLGFSGNSLAVVYLGYHLSYFSPNNQDQTETALSFISLAKRNCNMDLSDEAFALNFLEARIVSVYGMSYAELFTKSDL